LVSLDAVDKKILELLVEDSRMTVRDISRKLDVSPSTVSRKIRHMEEAKIIKGYVSIIEDKEVGRGARAVLLVRTSGDYNHNKIIDKITEMKDVCNLFLTMGNYDIILTACTTDEAELYQMINNLRTLDGVLWVDFASIVSRRKVLSKILPIPNDSVSV
jgi:DNA-binding Lrp family transcriptional regulator